MSTLDMEFSTLDPRRKDAGLTLIHSIFLLERFFMRTLGLRLTKF